MFGHSYTGHSEWCDDNDGHELVEDFQINDDIDGVWSLGIIITALHNAQLFPIYKKVCFTRILVFDLRFFLHPFTHSTMIVFAHIKPSS